MYRPPWGSNPRPQDVCDNTPPPTRPVTNGAFSSLFSDLSSFPFLSHPISIPPSRLTLTLLSPSFSFSTDLPLASSGDPSPSPMASWLKAAEDLFEVVDRRAKVVVGELSNENAESQSSGTASSAQEAQTRRTRSKEKARSKISNSETSKPVPEHKIKRIERNRPSPPDQALNKEATSTNDSVPGPDPKDSETVDSGDKDAPNLLTDIPIANENTANVTDGPKDEASMTDVATEIAPVNQDAEDDKEAFSAVSQEKKEPEIVEVKTGVDSQETQREDLSEKEKDAPKWSDQQEIKSEPAPLKVQDQLDEAQGLLKTAVKTGQSKEARLARVCAGLSSRLQEYKSENAQLEELLVQERERCASYESHIKQLEQDLSVYKVESSRSESNMADALSAKNTEIEALLNSIEALKKQVAASESKLTSLQEDMETNKYSRELTETRVIQALREELSLAERRAEEERVAHNATKMATVEREVELEHRAVEASNALARIQRASEESTSRAAELEHKVALLEVECASLHQEVQEMEAKNRRAQKKPSEEANQLLQMQAWQEEVERARQSQREAENKISSLEAELQKMRVEMAGMKRDAEHYSRQEHMELEKRYRDLTDLLYHKQTQLESMASEKAALEFQLEKEVKRLQEAQVEAERSRTVRRTHSSWEEDADIKSFEPLPLHHRHMAAASKQLNKAVKILDSGAVRATRFLWRYPVARVILLFYLVFVHLFLMYLMHRLQEQEVAATLGHGNTSLP
ncbi:Golgin-84 [Rhynchospora pubera]|uniref:Golgin-84 n=1 Tax=Rhynchospora pubera TaxID=906938 RepID=A0AAV8C337_9POAL|nr:Golgin-84 [Rhynchospora pubera]